MSQDGPFRKVARHCKGCDALKTHTWTENLGNGAMDSGTAAICVADGVNRHITNDYDDDYPVPSWCPVQPREDRMSRSRAKDAQEIAVSILSTVSLQNPAATLQGMLVAAVSMATEMKISRDSLVAAMQMIMDIYEAPKIADSTQLVRRDDP